MLVAFVVALLLLATTSYSKKVTALGHTLNASRTVVVDTPVVGLVTLLHTQAQAVVTAGQHLLRIERDHVGGSGLTDHVVRRQALRRQLSVAKREQAAAQRSHAVQLRLLDQQIEDLAQRLSLNRGDSQLLGQIVQLAHHNDQRAEGLLQQRVITLRDRERARQHVLQTQREMQQLQGSAAQVAAEIQQLKLQRQLLDAQQAQKNLAHRLQLEQLQQQLDLVDQQAAVEVRAPIDGVVDHLDVHPGQSVRAGQALLSIVNPDGRHSVELLVPSTVAARLQQGLRVHMRYAGFPVQEFGLVTGELRHVSTSPITTATQLAGSAQSLYQVHVEVLDSHAELHSVPAGLQVQADIVLAEDPLWRWLLAPVVTAMARI